MATIQGVYVALFGRPADPTGLAYFNGVTKNGTDLSAINNLAGEKEYTDRFAGQSNVQIVNSIYISLFNRAAEPTGLNFFVEALNKGTLNINNIAIAILDGAQGADKTIATNKIAAADLFTAALDTPSEIGSYTGANAAASARTWLSTVTTTAATQAEVNAQVKAIEVIGTGGVSITTDGTAGQAVSTTATDAKFKSTNGDDTITASASPATLKVDGGFGTDTLKITTSAAWAPADGDIKSIENLYVTAGGAHNVALTNVTGLKQVWNADSAANASVISDINDGATLGVKGASATVSFGFAKDQSGTTNIVLDKATVATSLTVTKGAETVALSTSGGSSVASFVDATVKTLNITGSGNLGITVAAGDVALTKVDASALTGGSLTLNLAAVVAGQKVTVTGSNAADTITLSANAAADVVVYNKAEASTYATFETITNFKADGAANIQDKIDLKAFALTKTSDVTLINTLVEGASYGTNSVAKFAAGADTFVFVDSNGDGVINQATDFAVKLIGAAVADVDVANFVFA